MDKDIIMVGAVLLVVILVRLCFYFEKVKFIHIMNHPETIQEMKKVPLWLKIRVWYQYGRYVGNYITEAELEEREYRTRMYWVSDGIKEKGQEYIESVPTPKS